jgi:hypothetical protein
MTLGANTLNTNRSSCIAVAVVILMLLYSSNLLINHTPYSFAQTDNTTLTRPEHFLPLSLGVKIASPINDEQVSVGNNNLKFIGTSTDSINSDCQVSVILNDIKPYQNVLPTGPGGKGDYSLWSFLLTPDYNATIREGPNKVTAKLSCANPNGTTSDMATHYSVFFKGVDSTPTNAAISSSSSTNQLPSSVTTSTIPATIDVNSTSIRALSTSSSDNNNSNNDSSRITGSTTTSSIPASIDTPFIPNPLSIKITSHIQNQTVPANKPLKISGISSDNFNSNCTVYADWNDQKPLQKVTPSGPNGANDYSNWTFAYTSNYHVVTEGANELTSKLDCGTGLIKYYTVNVTGINEQQVQASANETATSTNIGDPSTFPLQSTTPSLVSPPSSSSTTNEESDVSSDDEDSITGNSGDDDLIQEDGTIEQNTGNNNDFFEDNDESESSDEDIGDLFE